MLRLKLAAAALMVLLPWAGTATAEPIKIVGGSLDWQFGSLGTINLIGDSDRFTYSSRFASLHPFNPAGIFLGLQIAPDSVLPLLTRIEGLTIAGVATFRGATFAVGTANPASAAIDMEWRGSLVLPAGVAGGTLTAPFSFGKRFSYPGPPNFTPTAVPLTGAGLGSLTFGFHPAFADQFAVRAVRFDFEAASTEPVPEPASMLLVASGLARVIAARRRRHLHSK